MKIEFLEAAQLELDQAVEWYETQQQHLGLQFLDELDAALRRIAAYPQAYTLIDTNIRRCLVKRFPYGILYGIDNDRIIIVAIAHLHRRPSYWIERLADD